MMTAQSTPFSLIEIDGNLYYLSSMHIDECILKYSDTITTSLLKTFTTYAEGLSDKKITTIVFKNIDTASQEKKVVGFWHPQLSKLVLDTYGENGCRTETEQCTQNKDCDCSP